MSHEFGGGGGTFAQEAIVIEELAEAGILFGSVAHSFVAQYILAYGSEGQKGKWLPRMALGELAGAIAMTEPSTDSDLHGIKATARRDGDHYVINGSKTYVTNGWHANLICLAVKTDTASSGTNEMSLIMIYGKNLPGYRIGRVLEKVGMHAQDTCELFFDDVRVPASNLLGPAEGMRFYQIMDQLPFERISIGVAAVASAERAVAITTKHVKERVAFSKPLIDFQNTRFKLAECKTKAHIGRVFLDDCECRVIDECAQLHGGYGYVTEYPITRMWADSRVHRIYGGTNELMKELIGSSL